MPYRYINFNIPQTKLFQLFVLVPSMVQLHLLEGIPLTTHASEANKSFPSTFKVILEYDPPLAPGTIFNFCRL